ASEEAAGGEEGARRAAASPPAAMFLDLVMPSPGGAEVLRRLRADPATARVPVVVVTSKSLEPAERSDLEALGAVVLAKSHLAAPEALELVAEALRRAGASLELAALPSEGVPGG